MASESDIQAAFQECESRGTLPAAKLGEAARLAGASPSNAEVSACAGQSGGGLDLAAFKAFCTKTKHGDDDLKDLKELFRGADMNDTGKLPKVAMKKMLQSFGEPLTDDEFEAVVKEFARDGGENVDYASMLARIIQS
ncbi:putative myosin light chain MLC1 [Besnoitia besnoiti]|uniref:Calmodulin n=1 Tax=Besnoitia besnoiti TaxID=94643 RepID=A0A2A9MAA3_BESBE|nr:putative myosin light chain MLC1 [Besnoitia besnoiti]PFH34124.1 putative myosin light chain MLC1 [Besnoitia besnoiti]